jgi:DNA-binding NarL/FixJ family response regulator
MSLNVLIVDDHPMMRGALRDQIEMLDADATVDQSSTLADACRALATPVRRDLVVLDLNLPDATGLAALDTVKERFPEVPVIVVSGTVDRAAAHRCIGAGAAGFIPKTHSLDRIASAIGAVRRGDTYLPPEAGDAPEAGWRARTPLRPSPSAAQPHQPTLTERQQDVLQLILRGLPNKLICRQLKLAEGTVKVHVSAVLRALGVRTRTQAVLAASRLGMRRD